MKVVLKILNKDWKFGNQVLNKRFNKYIFIKNKKINQVKKNNKNFIKIIKNNKKNQ